MDYFAGDRKRRASARRTPAMTMEVRRCCGATLGLLWALATASCELAGGDMGVLVDLPGLPAAWEQAQGWELSVRTEDSVSVFRARALPARVPVRLPRDGPAVITLRPVFPGGLGLPYGALWPPDGDLSGCLYPDAAGGWAALSAEPLLGSAVFGGFDWGRLRAELPARLDDPWGLDPATVSEAIAAGGMRVSILSQPAPDAVLVTGLPPDCSDAVFWPDSPWLEPVRSGADGSLRLWLYGPFRRWFCGQRVLCVGRSPSGELGWTLSQP